MKQLLFLYLFLAFEKNAYAEESYHDVAEAPDAEAAAYSSVHIISGAGVTLSFLAKPDRDGRWERYEIPANQDLYISCEGCSTDRFYFYLKTGSKYISYKLEAERKYTIKWNPNKKLWDIYKVVN